MDLHDGFCETNEDHVHGPLYTTLAANQPLGTMELVCEECGASSTIIVEVVGDFGWN